MTPKQKELLEHIHMNGGGSAYVFGMAVIDECRNKGWVNSTLYALDRMRNPTATYTLTDAGRRALHEGGE